MISVSFIKEKKINNNDVFLLLNNYTKHYLEIYENNIFCFQGFLHSVTIIDNENISVEGKSKHPFVFKLDNIESIKIINQDIYIHLKG